VVLYGRGYRFGLANGRPDISGTGILVAKSNPNGASVFVDGHLTTATDNTINLAPGTYDVKIEKEGYFPWEKIIKVQKEVVSNADALLFPNAPRLESITDIGVSSPTVDPSLSKIAYLVSSQSAKKNGIYVLDMTSRPILTLESNSTQIIDDTTDTFSQATLAWSPDGTQILATVKNTTYLLSANGFNNTPKDVTETLAGIESSWEKAKLDKDTARLGGLKQVLAQIIAEDMKPVAWSADDTKLLYTASKSANLPFVITPRLIGTDSTPEARQIKEGQTYVYDTFEDKNYKIDTKDVVITPPSSILDQVNHNLLWLSDSKHLLFVHNNRIEIMEYDGSNATTIYAGPFLDHYVFPWQDASKVVILTTLGNTDISPNLYTIDLK